MNLSLRNLFGSSFVLWTIAAFVCIWYLFTITDHKISLRPGLINFGIDLVGGSLITLGVQTEKAIEVELHDKVESLLKKLPEEHLELPTNYNVQQEKAFLTFSSPAVARTVDSFITSHEEQLNSSIEGAMITVTFKDAYAQKIREWAVQGNIEVLRTRLDSLGVGEVHIAQQGEKNILIELPNIDDPQKAKAMIGKPALLEIKLIERIANNPDEILDEYDGILPDGMVILPGKEDRGYGKHYYLVPSYTDLTGRLLKDAYVDFGGQGQSEVVVAFKFNPEGGEKFYELTRKNYGRQLAVIIDGVVISDPRVSTTIGASGIIQGNFTQASAAELASLLKSGAFVAPVTFEAERLIGPSLGQESIRQGLIACLVGLLLLFVFSIVMYRLPGLFAFVTLLLNLIFILIALVWLKATLTLPGIAGMVLTVGMAIDASILIYEHIKEELAAGVTVKKAVQTGFSDAMEVILDSNITTFIVGVVLFKFGSGPIQGFAVTMMIGIVSTLITGLFFLRSIFTFLLYNLGFQKLKF